MRKQARVSRKNPQIYLHLCRISWHYLCIHCKCMKKIHPMRISVVNVMLIGSVLGLLTMGSGMKDSIRILRPALGDSIAYDQGKLFLASVAKSIGNQIVVSTQWKVEGIFDLATEDSRNNFAKDFYKVIPPKTTIERLTYYFVLFQGYAAPDTLSFSYPETVSIRSLWQNPKFIQLAKDVKSTNASELFISVQGWKDSTYDAIYDDPADDQRTLYKIQVKLLPGSNRIYFSPVQKKSDAFEYRLSMMMDSKATVDRENRFHNSKLEEGCATCHEGLPVSDKGLTMKADCNVCHKAMTMGSYLHSPAEMKECGSCHSWSAKSNAVVLEDGVPNTCYTCHDDKKKEVEDSPNPHPVAGECLTCHSPHGSEQKHILKEDMYTLCTGCHEHEAQNHPVGRHPVRYKIVKKTGEPISCASCHNPHGSPNDHLLRVGGGPMEVCTQCH